ncbi:hypothetical protein YYC_05834 [Plasmodium yoelii 17X]|uniref:Fam-b protein n=1 Tax=Plasmodium yoelii 17X TaxID=1323249 RepID=V7PA23_PLAYE|nr:hypothetical protein YYC_05834 [Plasmodium yoelii 17X]
MRISILKYVLSIVICSFEYAKNELYLERNITNFRNNRILADVDNRFDLNDFYQSTLSLENQLNDYNDDNEEIIYIRSAIDSHIKKHNESNTLPDLNNVDKKTKKLVNELRTELEEVKKELDNIGDSEITIKHIRDKRITKTYENNSVSEGEYYNQLKNEVNSLETEYKQFDFSNNHFENKQKLNKMLKGLIMRGLLMMFLSLAILLSGWIQIPFVIIDFNLIYNHLVFIIILNKLNLNIFIKL